MSLWPVHNMQLTIRLACTVESLSFLQTDVTPGRSDCIYFFAAMDLSVKLRFAFYFSGALL